MIQRLGIFLAAVAIGAGMTTAMVQTVRLSVAQQELADLRLEVAEANTRAANRAAELEAAVTKAQNEAKKREQDLRAAAAGARAESDGLRDDITVLRDQLAGATHAAAVDRAAAIGAVLQQCAARHQGLAERCDRHVNDIRTLMDGWPR